MPNIHRLLKVTGHTGVVAVPAVTVAGAASVLPGFGGPPASPTADGEPQAA